MSALGAPYLGRDESAERGLRGWLRRLSPHRDLLRAIGLGLDPLPAPTRPPFLTDDYDAVMRDTIAVAVDAREERDADLQRQVAAWLATEAEQEQRAEQQSHAS